MGEKRETLPKIQEGDSNPQSAIRNPQSGNPQSAIRNPQSGNPQSAIRNPQSIARSAGIVGLAVMGSRILGLIREQVFAAFFGAGFAMDAFIIAFRIPNLLRDLFAEGALSAAFVTTFSQTITKNGERAAWRLANLVNNGLIVVLSLIVIAGIAYAPQVVGLLIEPSKYQTDANSAHLTFDLAVKMTRIMLPFLLMVSLSAVAMGVLNTKDRFGIPASASTMFNVGSIIGGLTFAYLLAPDYIAAVFHGRLGDAEGVSRAIVGMAIGTLVGGILQWLIQVPSLTSVGYRWQPILSFRDEGVRQVMRLMAPAIIGSAALQVNVFVNTRFASGLGEGPVSWLSFAFRLIYLPIGIFGVAISTATLPAASRAAALDNLGEFRRTIAASLRLMFLLTIPSAVGLMVLSRPIISLIYEHGRFDAFAAEQTAAALVYNAIGLTAYSGVRVLAPAFYALKDVRIPMIGSLLSIVINYAVAMLTVEYLGIGHRGLALSISAVAIFNFLFLFLVMRHRLGRIEGRSLALVLIKVLAASCLMGAVCWLVSREIQLYLGTETKIERLVDVGASIAIGLAVLYAAARLLKVNEVDQLTEVLRRKFKKT